MIRVEGVHKSYAGRSVLTDVSFVANPGEVTGFLGPNGAGKSTTLRVLVGLVRPDKGRAEVCGASYLATACPARQVGVLLDASALHPGRTGRETLRMTAAYLGLASTRADECLDMVGMTVAGSRRVREYSLGMRQRLGLALALLADPQVLVLDEPANGMDPEGIRWLRDLLVTKAREGRTVLLSSHALTEVQKVADRIVVIRDGAIVANAPLKELLHDDASRVIARDESRLLEVVARAGLSSRPDNDGALIIGAPPEIVGDLCLDAGLALRHLNGVPSASLEDLVLTRPTADVTGQEGIHAYS